jgi:hypothetical protein
MGFLEIERDPEYFNKEFLQNQEKQLAYFLVSNLIIKPLQTFKLFSKFFGLTGNHPVNPNFIIL